MELSTLDLMAQFQESRVIKQVPLLSDQLIATTLFIDSGTRTPEHVHNDNDEIHFIIGGTGKIAVGGEIHEVQKGALILVHKKEPHYIESTTEKMIVLIISHANNITKPGKDEKLKLIDGGAN
jgi:mannose-6-phosphate isomerase-like protein (cupin superfamily)